MASELPPVVELRRLDSPAVTPQALAWHRGVLWIGSRDARRRFGAHPSKWEVVADEAAPGIPWGAVAAQDVIYFVLGEGPADDRYLRRYEPGRGFDEAYRVAVPEFTGSYLSFDDGSLYMSQWYRHRVLQLDPATGGVLRTVEIGAEICGHVFVAGKLYVLRGTEENGESWSVARLDLREEHPGVQDLARVPFACRSLTFDGQQFWTNHRAANQTVAFAMPEE